MKTSSIKSAESRKGIIGIDVDNRVRRGKDKLDGSKIDDDEVDNKFDDEVDNEVRKKSHKTSKSKNLLKSKKLSKSKKMVRLDFFTFRARLAFTELR